MTLGMQTCILHKSQTKKPVDIVENIRSHNATNSATSERNDTSVPEVYPWEYVNNWRSNQIHRVGARTTPSTQRFDPVKAKRTDPIQDK